MNLPTSPETKMSKTTYQTAIQTLLKDIPDHDESTLVYHQIMDQARVVDGCVEDMGRDANQMILFLNSFLRDLAEEATGGADPSGSLMYTHLVHDLGRRHAKYVARKEGLFTLVRLLLGDSNHKKFVDLVKKG
jgi:hypothetical protein